jgi:hypothetical protein
MMMVKIDILNFIDKFRFLIVKGAKCEMMGHAGIVLGLEVSRLARSSIEWHRLLEICALDKVMRVYVSKDNVCAVETIGLYRRSFLKPGSFSPRLLPSTARLG